MLEKRYRNELHRYRDKAQLGEDTEQDELITFRLADGYVEVREFVDDYGNPIPSKVRDTIGGYSRGEHYFERYYKVSYEVFLRYLLHLDEREEQEELLGQLSTYLNDETVERAEKTGELGGLTFTNLYENRILGEESVIIHKPYKELESIPLEVQEQLLKVEKEYGLKEKKVYENDRGIEEVKYMYQEQIGNINTMELVTELTVGKLGYCSYELDVDEDITVLRLPREFKIEETLRKTPSGEDIVISVEEVIQRTIRGIETSKTELASRIERYLQEQVDERGKQDYDRLLVKNLTKEVLTAGERDLLKRQKDL